MSPGLVDLLVIVGGVVLAAAGLILITRRRRPPAEQPEPPVVRLRPATSSERHAFYRSDLDNLDFDTVSPVAHCGTWPVDELEHDDTAPMCTPCERAVERMERRPTG